MKSKIASCIDAGTENCPCYLAQTGDCLICSRLAGKELCDCEWQGVCMYNEFRQSGGRIANPRKDFLAPIAERRQYLEDLAVFILDVGRGFAEKCSIPGSYVFLRARGEQNFYDVPISVMRADVKKGQIHLAVKLISAKTKALFQEEKALLVRGVYRNGIQGIQAVSTRRLNGGSLLIVTKGIGFAPAALIAEVFEDRAHIDLIVDTEKICRKLAEDYVTVTASAAGTACKDFPVEGTAAKVRSLQFGTLSAMIDAGELFKIMTDGQYDSVAVLASDYYVETVGKMAGEALPNAAVAVSSNFRICCGEGICGACGKEDVNGEIIKMCKCQTANIARLG